jgi:two-component system response regulator AtoC
MARILVVDDEPDVVEHLIDELTYAGWQAEGAFDGVEAVIKVVDGKWDAVLMDLRMPKLDGVNALRIMRRVAPQLPIITFTGQAGQGDMHESARLGAVTCLLKPVNLDKLFQLLQRLTPVTTR